MSTFAEQEHDGFSLELVGHSLGAGVAALITILLKLNYPTIDVHCTAYAPPCVISANLASRFDALIDGFVNEDDAVRYHSFYCGMHHESINLQVSRLSWGSVMHLKDKVELIACDANHSKLNRLVQLVTAGNAMGATFTGALASLTSTDLEIDFR